MMVDLDATLWLARAVRRAELASIRQLGCFTNLPGLECKYFATSVRGAKTYAELAQRAFVDGPYTIVVTAIDPSLLNEHSRAVVDRGIALVTIPTEMLCALRPPTILEDA